MEAEEEEEEEVAVVVAVETETALGNGNALVVQATLQAGVAVISVRIRNPVSESNLQLMARIQSHLLSWW